MNPGPIIRAIRLVGYAVDVASDDDETLVLTATEKATGEVWVVRGDAGDAYALAVELAVQIGVELED